MLVSSIHDNIQINTLLDNKKKSTAIYFYDEKLNIYIWLCECWSWFLTFFLTN